MDGVELLRLMLRDFEHLHGENVEAIFLKLLDNVANCVTLYGVRFHDGECTLKSLHNFVVSRSLFISETREFFASFARFAVNASRTPSAKFAKSAKKQHYFPPKAAATVSPISAGVGHTRMPAACMALIFSDAVPCPPEMIAPAWPMRRPGGAVCPAIKPTTGFFMRAFTNSAAVSSALPPISPIMITASVCGSRLKRSSASTKFVPMIGSPPMPIAVDCPIPRVVN